MMQILKNWFFNRISRFWLIFGLNGVAHAAWLPPLFRSFRKDYAGRLVVGKVDVDSNPGIASKFGIRNIPTILFFKDGAVVEKHVGAAPKTTLASKVDSIL